jgi:hypothetical protein
MIDATDSRSEVCRRKHFKVEGKKTSQEKRGVMGDISNKISSVRWLVLYNDRSRAASIIESQDYIHSCKSAAFRPRLQKKHCDDM